MFRNYLTVAVRHLNRQKGYASINVMSLALGIACALLILLYIRDELSYDRYHEKADRIYRVISEERDGDQMVRTAEVMMPTVRFMREDFPEVEDMVRFNPPGNAWMIKYGDRGFYERNFYLADSSVFNVFDVPLIIGDPRTALAGIDKVVLSESIARKYFGDEDPMGKILDAEGSFFFEVTGVMRDLPANTHLGFDILAAFRIQEHFSPNPADVWDWRKSYSYVLLRAGSDPDELESRLPAFVEKYVGDRYDGVSSSLTFRLQPVTDIHLHSHLERELAPNSDVRYVYLFGAIAVFIILIACINFMNLATARSAGRAGEIGLRKTFGAARSQVIRQFISESMFMTGLAVGIALLLAMLSLPWFNLLTGKSLSLNADTAWFALGAVAVIGAVAGLVSGSYPAFYLSGLAPVRALSGLRSPRAGNTTIRRVLVVGQFVISIALIICTGVVYSQLDFIRARNMGLNSDQVVAVPQTFAPVVVKSGVYKARLKEIPAVVDVSMNFLLPGHKNAAAPIKARRRGQDESSTIDMYQAWVDDDFIEIFGIELVAGRNFDSAFPGDWTATGAVVVNEAAVDRLGYASAGEALGKEIEGLQELITDSDERGELRPSIVGVVRDFHYAALYEPIEPLVLFPNYPGGYAMIKIDAGRMAEGLSAIEEAWHEVNPDWAFEYFFVEDTFARLHEAEERFARIFVSFAVLAVIIACLGLVGLSSFTAERRTKEIGVRKVLGASAPSLIALLSGEYFRLVIVAIVVAWPVAYLAMNAWLEGFAYRVDLSWTTFILAGVLSMAIALLTVGLQAARAAAANPVESLRIE